MTNLVMSPTALTQLFATVRNQTGALCAPLLPADFEAQSMPDASPVKWHLAHTTWFFEQFVLREVIPEYEPFHPSFGYLFNSYYVAAGERQTRAERGLLSRPTLDQVWDYRRKVEQQVLDVVDDTLSPAIAQRIELGCHHEQQHQELILTDVKHLFSRNALAPAYRSELSVEECPTSFHWVDCDGGLLEVGYAGSGFHYDNEGPRHRVYLEPFALADRLVTNGEYLEFIAEDGYRRAELWLDPGFRCATEQGWTGPLYWRGEPGSMREFTLAGERPLCLSEPVCHISFYEADAYARWAGARLPREHEWEIATLHRGAEGIFAEDARFHPAPALPFDSSPASGKRSKPALRQCFGDAWEWTASPYVGYPGYRPPDGALGEYNGKFMSNQLVLRGGSSATPKSHIRSTYRNFFYPSDRWQFSGLRLARDR